MSAGAERSIPRPTGYTEYQTQIMGDETRNTDYIHTAIEQLRAKVARDEPHLKYYSLRAEHTTGGDGVPRINIYLGFVPKHELAPPLNPRNLNEAPPPPIGSIPDEAELGLPLGWKEQQFKRGT